MSDDCPECGKVKAIEERLEKVLIMAPHTAADGIQQLKGDARWLLGQVKWYQKFAKQVVDMQTAVETVAGAVREEGKVADLPVKLIDAVIRLELAYTNVFTISDGPKDVA